MKVERTIKKTWKLSKSKILIWMKRTNKKIVNQITIKTIVNIKSLRKQSSKFRLKK
jgi:hypothetical protein